MLVFIITVFLYFILDNTLHVVIIQLPDLASSYPLSLTTSTLTGSGWEIIDHSSKCASWFKLSIDYVQFQAKNLSFPSSVKISIFVDYEHTLIFLRESKAWPRGRARKLPPARRCNAWSHASHLLVGNNFHAFSRGLLGLRSLRKIRDWS